MRKIRNDPRSGRRAAPTATIACMGAILHSLTAAAAPWENEINLDVGVIYTDNIFLASDGLEESEIVYTIVPEFIFRTDGDRLDVNFNYRPEAYFYNDFSEANDVYHSLDASMTSALISDALFLYLGASNSQSIVTPEGQIPSTNLPISGNRVDARTGEIRPYWEQRIGQADVLLETVYRKVDYNDENIQSNDERSATFRLNNIERQQGLAWGVEYRFRRIEYERSLLPWEFQRAELTLGAWVNSSTRIFASGGAETSIENFVDSSMDADFWEAGFQYRPNQRLNIELAAGDRSYGNSYRGNITYDLRRGNLVLSYDEGPATMGDQAFTAPPNTGDDILNRPGSNERFLRKRGEFNVQVELSRSDLTFRLFSEERTFRTTAIGTPLEDESYAGASLRWSWQMGTKTSMGVNLDYTERDQPTIGDDEIRSASVDLSYQLGQRVGLTLTALHTDQEGKVVNSFDYKENQLRLMLNTAF